MIRETVQSELERRGWSGYRLAQESGVAYTTLAHWLAGDRDMTGARIEAVLAALRIELRVTGRARK